MRFELKLAWKYFRARRHSLARFTSVIAVAGIAAGVASLIVAQALARGFADEMRDKILLNTAHISVFRPDGGEISDWRGISQKLASANNVSRILPTTYESAVLIGRNATDYAVVRVVSDESQIASAEPAEISLGVELAAKAGLNPGDQAELITIKNDQTPQTAKVMIRETFRTGLYEYDSVWINISPENYIRLTGKTSFTPTVLTVSVADIFKTDETAGELRASLGDDFRVLDWQEANRPLFAALSLEGRAALAIISLIIFIASLNITATLALLVNERRPDIGILRTCGARTRSLVAVFLTEGVMLGVIGIFFGVAAGLAGCFLGNYFRVVSLPVEVYSLSYVPFHPDPANILLIISVALLLSFSATVYPAFKASRIKPLENLRRQ